MGQRLGFGWFWDRGTSNTRLARRKLGKKTRHNQGSRHCLMALVLPSPPAPPHTTISQHAAQQVYVVKTRKKYCFYYLIAMLRHDASLTHRQCTFLVCLRVASAGGAESIILSVGCAESMMLSAHAKSMDTLSGRC